MPLGKIGFYTLKGISSASASVSGGFIGFFAADALTGNESIVPLAWIAVLFLLILILKAAEERLDYKVSEDDFERIDALITLIFTFVVFWATLGLLVLILL